MAEALVLPVVTGERAARGPAIRGPLGLSARSAARLVAGAAAGWVLLVLGSVAFSRYIGAARGDWSAAGWPKLVLVHLHLGSVNVAAAWFASMLRLGVGIGAAMCWLADRASLPRSARSGRVLSLGWLVVAGGFVALSLGAMGSLSDRLELAQSRGVLPLWGFDLLAAAVLVAAGSTGVFVLVHVSRRPRALVWAILGAALMPAASVAGQQGSTLAAESLELLASVAFLAAVTAYLVRRPGDPASADVPLRTAVLATAGLGGVVAAAFVASTALAARVATAQLGIVQDWFTSAPAMAVAIGFAWLGRPGDAAPAREGRPYGRAAAFCAVVSLYSGACLGYWLSELPDGTRVRPLVEGAMIAVAWILAWGLARGDERWWGRAAVLAWAGLLSVGLADSDPSASWREAMAFGLLGLALLSHAAVAAPQNLSVRPPTPRQ